MSAQPSRISSSPNVCRLPWSFAVSAQVFRRCSYIIIASLPPREVLHIIPSIHRTDQPPNLTRYLHLSTPPPLSLPFLRLWRLSSFIVEQPRGAGRLPVSVGPPAEGSGRPASSVGMGAAGERGSRRSMPLRRPASRSALLWLTGPPLRGKISTNSTPGRRAADELS